MEYTFTEQEWLALVAGLQRIRDRAVDADPYGDDVMDIAEMADELLASLGVEEGQEFEGV